MKTAVIIQARMGSTRLPGKVLMPLRGKPVLSHVINRVRQAKCVDEIVIATTLSPSDDPICDLATQEGVVHYRGSELDVLERYYYSAQSSQADKIIRITSDCPLIDPGVIDATYELFETSEADFVSNTLTRTFPRGLDVEIFNFNILEEAYREAISPEHREHVTAFMYTNPQRFSIAQYTFPSDESRYRWTLDTTEDWELIQHIYKYLGETHAYAEWTAVLRLMKDYPHLVEINANVEQKKLGNV